MELSSQLFNPATQEEVIAMLQEELSATNREVMALTLELEKRVEQRTTELRNTQEELEETNSELLQLTLELEDRVAQRTKELEKANESLQAEIIIREETQKALQQKTNEINSFFTVLLDLLCITDINGNFKLLNSAWEKTLGYTLNELESKSFHNYVHPDDLTATKEVFSTLASRQKDMNFVNRYRCKDGTYRWFEWQITSVDKLIYAAARDITSRKLAEENLRKAEVRYRITLDHMLEGCQIIGYDWRYIYVNEVAAIHGHSTKDKFIGRTMMEMHPGIENTLMFTNLRRCMEHHVPLHMENEFEFQDGTKEWLDLSFEPVPEGIFILSIDITARKCAEEEIKSLNKELEKRVIQRTSQLEAVNKELEAFSYSVSHDLRAPLRHINGYVDLLLERFHESLSEKGKHYLDAIADSTHQMGNLIDDLLQFSRAGRQELFLAHLNMNSILQEVLDSIKQDITERCIEWEIAALPDVNGDYSLLRSVWFNLLGNAVKFTRTREYARIEIGFREHNREHVFFVRDNGAGFDMQYAHKLFGVFQRLHSSHEFEGTGIGLANVRRIISKHGGNTWAEAELDKGAIFYFSLPKNKEE